MLANKMKVGQRFKNKQTGDILEVRYYCDDVDNMYVFEDIDNGDLYTFVDEDLYDEIEKHIGR